MLLSEIRTDGKAQEGYYGDAFYEDSKADATLSRMCIIFQEFCAEVCRAAAKLTDMTAKTFNWNKSSWTFDYEAAYETFKEELTKCTALYYPDYNLPWILRVDASEDGIGWVLMQDPSGSKPDASAPDPEYQPLVFGP